jgi:YHS domain-containing protein
MAQYTGTLDDGRISFGRTPDREPESPVEVKDRVCGKMINSRDAVTIALAGHDYHFCSAECAIRFEANPNQFSD